MDRFLLLCLCLVLVPAGAAMAGDQGLMNAEPAAKRLSGMSIVGNDEAPKSLYIVPWKKSDIGSETSLNRILTERAMPVDREEFMRQLDFYEAGAGR